MLLQRHQHSRGDGITGYKQGFRRAAPAFQEGGHSLIAAAGIHSAVKDEIRVKTIPAHLIGLVIVKAGVHGRFLEMAKGTDASGIGCLVVTVFTKMAHCQANRQMVIRQDAVILLRIRIRIQKNNIIRIFPEIRNFFFCKAPDCEQPV